MSILYDGIGNKITISDETQDKLVYTDKLKGLYHLALGDSLTNVAGSYARAIEANFGNHLYKTGFFDGGQAAYAAGTNYSIHNRLKNGSIFSIATSPDIITILLGINDYHNSCPLGTIDDDPNAQTEESYTFYGCYKSIIEMLMSRYGVKSTLLITPITSNNLNTANSVGLYPTDYADAVIEIAGHYGYPVLDLTRYSGVPLTMVEGDYASDGLHLSPLGWSMVTPKIYYKMNECVSRIYTA